MTEGMSVGRYMGLFIPYMVKAGHVYQSRLQICRGVGVSKTPNAIRALERMVTEDLICREWSGEVSPARWIYWMSTEQITSVMRSYNG